jgi:hypothetical protein
VSAHALSTTDPEIYKPLRKTLDNDGLVLFAGSGLSAQAETKDGRRPPGWRGLLRGMARWALDENLLKNEDEQEIWKLLEAGYFIDAGQELAECLQAQLRRCVAAIILANEAETGRAHELVAKIKFSAYLTTNYDSFIENAFLRLHSVELPKFYARTILDVREAWRRQEQFVFKLHGDIQDPDTLVLGTRSYESLMVQRPDYISVLDMIISTASVLFVGFGGTDPDLEAITSRVSQFDGHVQRHWMVVPQGELPPLRAKRLAYDRGIQVIEYPHDPKQDPNHGGLVEFLDTLAQPEPVSATPEGRSRPPGAFAASTVGTRN